MFILLWIVISLLMVYLLYALINPEKF
ncbi:MULTISPECIES: K(+)-transporting ATPase subunit F [Pseudolactococcus]|uniref:K(+)-transporting ATPase subunit F n=1 Tax=Pseudolactococcus carnosus TaxID=2749961 RepID=A0ABT0AQ98_9LACT|nr:K(+)-transporting ATPase subunit F [Lactococcus carnosus]MCJ1988875.1 K(+)-transporting ATPase subunit F [Lactococcus carnosus]